MPKAAAFLRAKVFGMLETFYHLRYLSNGFSPYLFAPAVPGTNKTPIPTTTLTNNNIGLSGENSDQPKTIMLNIAPYHAFISISCNRFPKLIIPKYAINNTSKSNPKASRSDFCIMESNASNNILSTKFSNKPTKNMVFCCVALPK